MFDSIYCRVALPEVGVRPDEFQTKDTPAQFLDVYEIRADGTLWHELYDTVDRSNPKAVGLGRLAGSMARQNQRWEREYLSGSLRFYADSELGWLEFEALFLDGKLVGIQPRKDLDESSELSLRFEPGTVDRLTASVRSEERQACAQIVLDRAREAEEGGDQTLGLILRALALRMRT